ncbi:MAG: type III-B CRISPR module-associated Cmr3 family protein [Coleofasciculaceae cyanobacterium]
MFCHLIIIQPLGFLYGSVGPFLSPDNLVGRSGNSFPPSAATVSGLYAAQYSQPGTNERGETTQRLDLPDLILTGPFWAYTENPQNFYVPTPFNYLAEMNPPEDEQEICQGKITEKLTWNGDRKQWQPLKVGKFDTETWLPINEWEKAETVSKEPWRYLPHLHPRLEIDQRRVDTNLERGSLFLENSVQMHPDTCLVYLTNTPIDEGWYRFGGEGHLVDVQCQQITNEKLLGLLNKPVEDNFALITPAVWGSNRFSYRFPTTRQGEAWKKVPEWENGQIFTERPLPFRYRLGGTGETKRLARGRYAVPAGTVYVLKEPLKESWFDWNESWFPCEGYSYKRWGCGFALPL